MWGFLNTLQIIYYFPFLSFYFPSDFETLLKGLQVSKMEINLNVKSEYLSRLSDWFIDYESLSIFQTENVKFIDNGVESTSILMNFGEISYVLV